MAKATHVQNETNYDLMGPRTGKGSVLRCCYLHNFYLRSLVMGPLFEDFEVLVTLQKTSKEEQEN